MASPSTKKKFKSGAGAASSSAPLAFSIESIMGPSSAQLNDSFSSSASSTSSRSGDELLHCGSSPEPTCHSIEALATPHSNANTANNNNNHAKPNKHNNQKGERRAPSSSTGANNLVATAAESGSRLDQLECQLDNNDMWHRFAPLDTEMIITKQGRRMFPPVRVAFAVANQASKLANTEPLAARDKFHVLMDVLPYDNKRYRYAYHKSSWQQAGKADPRSPTKLFLHPDGPFTLDQLKRQVISFEKIKLTNNDANKHGYIVLNSMHKYQPRIHLVLWRGKESQNLANAPVSQLEQEIHKTFIFKETIFTAVTAYQNHSITKLKIDSNPFAKGFRDSSRLTDLELESMTDLMSEGQCPFSPPRAPPHGFPHFLFAAAAASAAQQHGLQPQQQQHGPLGGASVAGQMLMQQAAAAAAAANAGQPEDPAAALLRERTIIALDSFLQHQHQHQTAPPPSVGSPASCGREAAEASPGGFGPRANHHLGGGGGARSRSQSPQLHHQQQQLQQQPQGNIIPGTSQRGVAGGAGQQPATSLEQLIMQQQHQFAVAMAAAAAAATSSHSHHYGAHQFAGAHQTTPLHGAAAQPGGAPNPYHFHALLPGGAAPQQQQQQHQQYGAALAAAAAAAAAAQVNSHHHQHSPPQTGLLLADAASGAAAAAAAASANSAAAQEQYIYIENLREFRGACGKGK